MKKVQKKEKTRKFNQKKARNMVGPEFPGEGAVKKLAAGSNSRYHDNLIHKLKFLIKKFNRGLGTGKCIYKAKGLTLVPINWDTLSTRKLKMEAWSNDTAKKEEKENPEKRDKLKGVHENQEKK